jgi:hypothetical protein
MKFIKLTLPLIIVFVFGLVGFAIQYIPHPTAEYWKEGIFAVWLRIAGGVAGLLGVYALIQLHVDKVKKQEEGWGYSLFFFGGFLAVVLAAAYNGGQWFWRPMVSGAAADHLYDYLFAPAGAAIFSLLGFYIASAAVRTFRARSFEATLLLAAAIIVMLGRAPLGEMMTMYFPRVTEWIMAVPNAAAKRGVFLGIYLGMTAMSLRIIFGLERSYLGGKS